MKNKRKQESEEDDPKPAPLTTDHFDLTMKRLEDVYLDQIKDDVDSVEKSMSKVKTCIEIVCVAIAGAAIIYAIRSLLEILKVI